MNKHSCLWLGMAIYNFITYGKSDHLIGNFAAMFGLWCMWNFGDYYTKNFEVTVRMENDDL